MAYVEFNNNPVGELYRLIETTSDERTKDELKRILDRI